MSKYHTSLQGTEEGGKGGRFGAGDTPAPLIVYIILFEKKITR